jgi:Zinc carboxypeptidase
MTVTFLLPRRTVVAVSAALLAPIRFLSLITFMTPSTAAAYKIGTPGTPWGDAEKLQWRNSREIQRSYADEVVSKIQAIQDNSSSHFDIHNYGALSQNADRYKLYAAQSKNWNPSKPSVLITGGVHGYETSGVQGALLFLQERAHLYTDNFNILVAPCVSPWGYETIQRWNAQAVDPNRSFNPHGKVVQGRSFNPEAATEESQALITFLERKISSPPPQWICHLDLHETTDTDASEFRPAKAARDGILNAPEEHIPDGFYLVSDATNPQPAWYKAMIDAVRTVTHIAPADEHGKIIGEVVTQDGVIQIPSPRSLGLCAGVTDAPYATTTEVYPDSPTATAEQCNRAQVACIEAALKFIMENETEKCAAKT